jgi:hypothetical protein
VCETAHADSTSTLQRTSTLQSWALPLRMVVFFRLPADSLFPGHNPAHEAR